MDAVRAAVQGTCEPLELDEELRFGLALAPIAWRVGSDEGAERGAGVRARRVARRDRLRRHDRCRHEPIVTTATRFPCWGARRGTTDHAPTSRRRAASPLTSARRIVVALPATATRVSSTLTRKVPPRAESCAARRRAVPSADAQ